MLFLHKHKFVNVFTRHIIIIGVLLGAVVTGVVSLNLFAQVNCSSSDVSYTVRSGDTLGAIANSHNTSWQSLVAYDKLTNPGLIFPSQTICIPIAIGVTTMSNAPIHGTGNYFAFPQCTWHANNRYHQLHGIYVPWTTNSNANEWTARAHDFHWIVTTKMKQGAIVNFQAGVQGAFSLGHVAVVEQLLPNGHFIASSLDWFPSPTIVNNSTFHEGPGVTFIASY